MSRRARGHSFISFSPLLLYLYLSGCAVPPPTPITTGIKESSPDSLTLEQKVAQLFMVDYTGQYYSVSSSTSQNIKKLVQETGIGGIILFYGSVSGSVENLNELQKIAKIPLLVAADFERGVGQLLEGATLFPTNMAIAATGDPELAYKQGMVTAKEAKAVGVHMVFAPVMDVNTHSGNPIINFRSYGDSPELVTTYGTKFIQGLQDHGVIATVKHFPGHGNTAMDSHLSLPVIQTEKELFEQTDLLPFKNAVQIPVGAVMTGHLAVPSWEEAKTPASLSPYLVNGLLRKKYNFKGLIVTDALNMGAITESFWQGEAAIRALEAGSDIILMPLDVEKSIRTVIEAVKSGRLNEKQIDEAFERILSVKKKLHLWNQRLISLEQVKSRVGINQHQTIASEIARKSVTLVKDERNLIPVPVGRIDTLTHLVLGSNENMLNYSSTFRSAVSRIHDNVRTYFYYMPLSDGEIQNLVDKVSKSNFILISLFGGEGMNPVSHIELILELQKTGKPMAVVSFGIPYLSGVEQIGTYLCAYGYGAVSQNAVADAIFGTTGISGKLPVTLSSAFPQGHGLSKKPAAGLMLSEPEKFDFTEAEKILTQAIKDSIFPGAQAVVIKNGKLIWTSQIGKLTYNPASPSVKEATLYDVASLTKVVATTPVIMKLIEQRKLSLNEPVFHFFLEFKGGGKEIVTIRHLLTHSSGLPSHVNFPKQNIPPEQVINYIVHADLIYPPGTKTAYSDLGFILLGEIIKVVTGENLDELSNSWFYQPLGMTHTIFNPALTLSSKKELLYVAPTEVDTIFRKGIVQGVVHDENAWWVGGVAGHAGLFSTAEDLSKFAQMMIDKGFFGGKRYVKRSTVTEFTRRQAIFPRNEKALGWDTPSDSLSSAGDYFTRGSYGHLGFTGSSLWIDPNQKIAVILLTNRVHPTRNKSGIYQVRRDFHNAIMKKVISKV